MSPNSSTACQDPMERGVETERNWDGFALRCYTRALLPGYLRTTFLSKTKWSSKLPETPPSTWSIYSYLSLFPKYANHCSLAVSICCFLFICYCLSHGRAERKKILKVCQIWSQCISLHPSTTEVPCIQYILSTYALIIQPSVEQWFSKCGPGPAESVSPRNLLEIQSLGSQPCWIRISEGGVQQSVFQ